MMMMMMLFGVLCLLLLSHEGQSFEWQSESGYQVTRFRGSVYTLLKKRQDYSTSQAECEDLGMHLAVITDEAEQEFIVKLVRDQKNSKDTWIGLHKTSKKPSSLRWVDGTPFVFGDDSEYYQPWAPREPGKWQVSCIRLEMIYNGAWADWNCEKSWWAVCEKIVPPEPTYTLHTDKSTWDEAAGKCEDKGKQLAVLNTQAKWKEFREDVNLGDDSAWIGLNDKDATNTFVWLNDENMGFDKWDFGNGQPRHETLNGDPKDCAVVDGSIWKTTVCTKERNYICEG